MITMAQIRAKYPTPKSTKDVTNVAEWAYCVGGALYQYLRPSQFTVTCFPGSGELKSLLMTANPYLADSVAEFYATGIIALNDSGMIEAAWATLDRALTYGVPLRGECITVEPEVVTHEGELVPA